MVGEIEWRMVVELGGVLGVTPHQCADRSALVQGVECSCGVPACLGLADLKAARRFTQGHGRLAELGEQDWCICREPAGELGKEGHELLVGGACSVAVWAGQ